MAARVDPRPKRLGSPCSAAKTNTLGQFATPDTKSSNGVLSPRFVARVFCLALTFCEARYSGNALAWPPRGVFEIRPTTTPALRLDCLRVANLCGRLAACCWMNLRFGLIAVFVDWWPSILGRYLFRDMSEIAHLSGIRPRLRTGRFRKRRSGRRLCVHPHDPTRRQCLVTGSVFSAIA